MGFKLSQICEYAKGKINVALLNNDTYISTENMLPDKRGIDRASSLPTIAQTQEFKPGDVLVSNIRPYFKKIWQATFYGGCSNDVLVFRAKEKTNSDFLYYVLADDAFFNYSMATSKGTKMPRGDKTALMEYEVPDFSYETQRKIGSILKSIDEKIKNNNAINDNLVEMMNAYYKALFSNINQNKCTVGDFAERIYSGGTPSTTIAEYWNGEFPWLSSGETKNRFVVSPDKCITQSGIDNSSTREAEKYDIVIASAGQGHTRGQTSMLFLNTYINQSVIAVHAQKKILPYLFWNISNRYDELRAISDSSSIRGSLTTKMISAFEIPYPSDDGINAFSALAWSVLPQIENNLKENIRLSELRDSLLPRLMSGEIDVSAIAV